MAGMAKIWKTKPIEMKVMAMPASDESRAARGVCRRSQSPTEGSDALQNRTDQAGEQSGLPGQVRIFGLKVDRSNNQKNEGNAG